MHHALFQTVPWPCDAYIFVWDTDKKSYIVIRKLCNMLEDKSHGEKQSRGRRTRSVGSEWSGTAQLAPEPRL